MPFPTRIRALWLVALGLCAAPATLAEATRTLRTELPAANLQRFAVENLAGIMRVKPGSGDTVVAVATVHAETEALANSVRLEHVTGQNGIPTLSVRYPLDHERTIRYPDHHSSDDWGFLDLFSFSSSKYRYGGRTVRVSHQHGVLLYADVEVQVPRGRLEATFRNLVGRLEAEGLEGRLRFEVESADLRLDGLSGDLELEGSSGDTRASDIRSWKSDFSSGDCVLDHFEGDLLSFHTSSGDVETRSVKARRLEIETSSGDAQIRDADIEELAGNSSSGDIELDSAGRRLAAVRVTTSSGDVALRLPADASFEAEADQSSGDLTVGFSDGSAVRHRNKLTAYRRGNGGSRIQVRTSSGDLVIEPR